MSRERCDKTPWTQYGITLNGEWNLDVPEESRSTSNYCATLGHKCNHSFQSNCRLLAAFEILLEAISRNQSHLNYRFSRIDHPRFGLIICVMAKRDLSAGEEILVNYNMDMALAPEWYKVKE